LFKQIYNLCKNFSETVGLAVEPYARQHEPKWPQNYFTYDVSHKKSVPPTKKFFFEWNILDWLICLSPSTALYRNRQRS